MVLPERNDRGMVHVWNRAGLPQRLDQVAIRTGLNWLIPDKSPADVICPRSVHGRRHLKYRNDMEWLAFLEQHPGASRDGWGGAPTRCERSGYTQRGPDGDTLTQAGLSQIDIYRMPF